MLAPMSERAASTFMVLGDLHDHWREQDRRFLESGSQELALFVGDLGDENVEIVQEIAELTCEKAVILGNHDAWQSFSLKSPTTNLYAILEELGDDHLGYAVREAPRAGVSVVGARPFSWGGRSLRSPEVYDQLYGVRTHEDSVRKIVAAARDALHRDVVILAHNGPTGLSSQTHDIYGKDFGQTPGGDWGDRDLEEAMVQILDLGLRIPCVVAGHMHHRLSRPRGALRDRFVRKAGTLYVNPAVVPRLKPEGEPGAPARLAHFMQLTFLRGEVTGVEELWVGDDGRIREVITPEIKDLD